MTFISAVVAMNPGAFPSVMIEKFAGVRGTTWSEFLGLNHTSKSMIQVSLLIPKFARDTGIDVWRTSASGHLSKVRL
jgi:hypothetical protein